MSTGEISAVKNSSLIGSYTREAGTKTPAKSTAKTAGVATPVQANRSTTPVQQVPPVFGVGGEVSAIDTAEAVNQVREYVQDVVPELDFSIDEDTGKIVVKVMDTATNEVLRQIPSEEMLQIAKMLDKLQGLLFKDRA